MFIPITKIAMHSRLITPLSHPKYTSLVALDRCYVFFFLSVAVCFSETCNGILQVACCSLLKKWRFWWHIWAMCNKLHIQHPPNPPTLSTKHCYFGDSDVQQCVKNWFNTPQSTQLGGLLIGAMPCCFAPLSIHISVHNAHLLILHHSLGSRCGQKYCHREKEGHEKEEVQQRDVVWEDLSRRRLESGMRATRRCGLKTLRVQVNLASHPWRNEEDSARGLTSANGPLQLVFARF